MLRIKEGIELIIVLGFVIACHVSSKIVKPEQGVVQDSAKSVAAIFPTFDKEGHRGCRGLMPENTVPAMIKAISLGVTTLEMDAQVTKDQKIVISHDPYFNHDITTKPDGSLINSDDEKKFVLYNMTYDEIKTFDVGSKPYPKFPQQQKLNTVKPLLENLIDSVENYCRTHKLSPPFYNIETKSTIATDNVYHPSPDKFVALLMDVINKKNIASRAIVQSFDIRTLQIIYEKYPGIKTSLLVSGMDRRTLFAEVNALGFPPTIYSPEYSLVNENLISQCHQLHIKIIPWTVDDKPNIDKFKNMGVDGIITDYPNLFN